jgi:CubicO group peptidase (beta-lactamase class C family)
LSELAEALPRTAAVIQEGIDRGLHTGVQIYVSLEGRAIADYGTGEGAPGELMTPETIMLWLSAGKPLTAVLVAKSWEQGRLDLDAPVARYVPEFANRGKDSITLHHLLTHTSGLRHIQTGWPDLSWDETIARICEAEPEPDWPPGERAGYHVASSWFVLGEVLRRIDGRPFSQSLRAGICEPLGMIDTWNGMPPDVYRSYVDSNRFGLMHERQGRELKPFDWNTELRCTRASPGGNTRGPIRELGRLYEMLLGGGVLDGVRILQQETVETFTARHRTGMYDETFRHRIDFGFGFIVDSNRYGAETVPYAFGRYCSPRTFGHGGAQSSIGFADPEHGLVVAWVANGRPGEPQHNRRNRTLSEAIYWDMGLATDTIEEAD